MQCRQTRFEPSSKERELLRNNLLRLAYLGETYGTRPSEYLEDLEPYEAFCVDEAALFVLAQEKRKIQEGCKTDTKDSKDQPVAAKWADLSTFNSLRANAKQARQELVKKTLLKR